MERFKKDKLAIVQIAAELIAAIGVSKVISQIIENNTESDSAMDRLKVKVGSFVIGFMVVDFATTYVSRCVKGFASWWTEAKEELNETSTEE